MNVIDKVTADTLEPGDKILYEGSEWEIISLDSDEDDVLSFEACNRDNGDEDSIVFEPFEYVDLLEP